MFTLSVARHLPSLTHSNVDVTFFRSHRSAVSLTLTVISILALAGCASHSVNKPSEPITYVNGVPSYYIVKSGDTLSHIASRYRLDYRKVAALNGLDGNYTVYTGQKLRLAGVAQARRTTALRPRTPLPTNNATYRPPVYAPLPATATQKVWVAPVVGSIIKPFNPSVGNKGSWYGASVGTPVVASQSGTVLYAGDKLSEYGNLIMIRHDSDFVSAYAHLNSLNVREGQTIQAGQQIGTVGTINGQPAMEFQIRYRGTPVNPTSFLK